MTHPSIPEAGKPVLRSISPEASPDEVAAIVAAIEECVRSAPAPEPEGDVERMQEWVRGSRLGARRAGLQRGPWRISGRISRRSRA